MIKLENIYKEYQTRRGTLQALHDVNLEVARGEIVGVIGRSGAGKSTLIRCANLLERPTSGRVFVNDKELTALSAKALREARHSIGMIFQQFNLLATRTVAQNIAFPLQLLGVSNTDIRARVDELLELTGLVERRQGYPSQLSGGQKQRVAIARALATNPQVLLCDEMTSALDPETTRSVLQLIKQVNEAYGISVLFITHEMEVVKMIADRVAVIEDGQIIELSSVVQLFKNPQTPMARSLVQHELIPNLPPNLVKALQPEPINGGFAIVQMLFSGNVAGEPIINDLVRQCPEVSVDILQANLEYLRQETIGMMVLSLFGDLEEQQRALQFIENKDLKVEVLGYVASNAWAIN